MNRTSIATMILWSFSFVGCVAPYDAPLRSDPRDVNVATSDSAYSPRRDSWEGEAHHERRNVSETLHDGVLVTKVKTKLLADPEVSGLVINVDSYRGVVTLHGRVGSVREAEEAVRLASSVAGVVDVSSDLVVVR